MMRRAPIPGILFVSDLPSDCKKRDLLDIFHDYGPIENVEVVCSDDKFINYGRITFKYVVDAMNAADDLGDEELILGEPLK